MIRSLPKNVFVKFTIISHAGLFIETRDCSILIDPWLVGSCYWRSWWNYPPPPEDLVAKLSPDYIYLTHLHWDHFHSPSLKRFNSKTPILVPRAHFDRMVKDLNSIGFYDVRELTHGVSYRLSVIARRPAGRRSNPDSEIASASFGTLPRNDGLSVTSYQFGLALDSALLVDTGREVLLDANDCKLMGAPLRQIASKYPKIDFVFKSHSSASAYPFCVSSEFPEHLGHRSNEDYAEEFLAFAECVNAQYAVPFASNHCFLHKETKRFNDTIVSPYQIKSYFDAYRKTEALCQVMLPGDSWSAEHGFSIGDQNYFTDRQRHLKELEHRYSEKLERFYAKEDAARPHWESFQKYFSELFSTLPIGSEIIFPGRILFHVTGAESADWLVDFRKKKILRTVDESISYDIRLETHANILRDCCQKKMFSVFTASKRVHYHLETKQALRYYFIFNTLMDMYESEYFPLHLMLRRRFLSNWFRRWREILFYISVATSILLGRAKLRPIDHLAPHAQ